MTPQNRSTTRRLEARALAPWLAAIVCAAVAFFTFFTPRVASAQPVGKPAELEHVGVNEHLDKQLPLDTAFRDHTGKPVKLGDFFDGKRPVVLTFAYHTCPVLCGMILNNEAAGLKEIPWTLGKEYQAVTISIDPNESLEKTAQKKNTILSEYGRSPEDAKNGWHFLVGDAPQIAAVANAAGFEYQYDERQKQWGHPSVVMIVTPDGKMARYLYGLEFTPADLRLGLLEASKGHSISTVEKIILYCYHYDPQGGKYVLVAQHMMQVGGGVIALLLGGMLGLFWMRELKKKKAKDANRPAGPEGPDGSGDDPTTSDDDRARETHGDHARAHGAAE